MNRTTTNRRIASTTRSYRRGRESEFPPTEEVGNRSSLLQRGRESEFPPTKRSGIGVPSYKEIFSRTVQSRYRVDRMSFFVLKSRSGIGVPSYKEVFRCIERLGLHLILHLILHFLISDSRVQFFLCLSTGTAVVYSWVYPAAYIRSLSTCHYSFRLPTPLP